MEKQTDDLITNVSQDFKDGVKVGKEYWYSQGKKGMVKIEDVINKVDKIEKKTYNYCTCGDYDEGCLRCLVEDIKQSLKELGEKQ
jgi:hypothetical protein